MKGLSTAVVYIEGEVGPCWAADRWHDINIKVIDSCWHIFLWVACIGDDAERVLCGERREDIDKPKGIIGVIDDEIG